MLPIIPAVTPEHIAAVRGLLLEYAHMLDADLCFQGFEEELAGLPGKYAPPRGALLLAMDGDTVAGCIALRPLDDPPLGSPAGGGSTCEMKRLYVRDAYRGGGLGRALAAAVIAEAVRLGYTRMVLDTLERLVAATHLYRALGFREISAYYHNPLPGVTYWELALPPREVHHHREDTP